MSHAATIDYEALSIAARATCEQALKQLCQIDEVLARIKKTASTLLTERVRTYEAELKKEQASITRELNKVIENANARTQDISIVNNANALAHHVNDLTTSRLSMIEDIIDEELMNAANKHQAMIENERLGIIAINQDVINELALIEDFVLRDNIYHVAILKENTNKSWAALKVLGEERMRAHEELSLTKHKDKIIESIKREMAEARVDVDTIKALVTDKVENTDDVKALREKATAEIINENVRKETLKVIIKTIESRSFIVDKKNIKIDREKNEVRFVAQKLSGERAEFKIYLDGKFIYKFDGYEGQACQEDIEPFMTDLADIYDIKVVKQVDNWSNPDKNQTMKYQTVKINKGKK